MKKFAKQEAEEEIKKLVEKYRVLSAEDIKGYNEANTRKNFILPFFEALGWDIRGEEVMEEESASGKRVDYAFKIGGITKFFLEAKPLSADLDVPKWADQAIWYAWHKSVPWAILTDFESIKVFNAEWDELDAERNLVFEIPYKDYLTNEKIWLLSREAIEKGELEKFAETEFRKPKRVAVDKQLIVDLLRWRDQLSKDFKGYNPLIDEKKISENVQRVLNRLIFIRTCEDRGLEEKKLQEIVRNWEVKNRKSDELVNNLRELFLYYDKFYDSKLFEERIIFESEKFVADDNTLAKVIEETYKNPNRIRWNFNDINQDVLGSIYEQYLGYIQKEERQNGNDGKTKRKSQGIYYTPRYIVNYIIQNTLGEILKTKNSEGIKDLKILDPACGSGSFLIRAYEELINYWEIQLNEESKFKKGTHLGMIEKTIKQKEGQKTLSAEAKMNILRNNIYGVDLDEQAVEIAQLNLLLKTVDKRAKLPNLQHILCGNSLISGDEKELKKYFGKNWIDKGPFNWREKFPEVYKDGGFGIIIGNPPWGADLDRNEKLFIKENFKTGTGIIDSFALFIEQASSLLLKGGLLGFILPDIILLKNYPIVRKLILDNFRIVNIFYTGMAFEGVNLDSVILILKKEQIKNSNLIKIYRSRDEFRKGNFIEIDQKIFLDNQQYKFNLFFDETTELIKNKLEKKSIKLGEISEIHEGIHSGNIRQKLFVKDANDGNFKKLLFKGKSVRRYSLIWDNYFVNYSREIIEKKKGEYANLSKEIYFESPKILIRRTGDEVIATYDENNYYASNNFFTLNLVKKAEINYKFLLILLNSKLITWYFNLIQPRKGKLFAEIKINHIKEFPIYRINFTEKIGKTKHDELIKLADKMIDLNKKLQKLHPVFNDEEYKGIEEEVKKTDKEIDKKVYRLYDLTPEEIKIIEKTK